MRIMMMTLHRSASESTFSRRHGQPASPPSPNLAASAGKEHRTRISSSPSFQGLRDRPEYGSLPPRRVNSYTPRASAEADRDPSLSTTPSSSSISRIASGPARHGSITSSKASEQRQLMAKPLGKAASQQTVLTGSSTTAFSRTAWASEDSVDCADGGGKKKRKPSSKSKRRLILPPSPSDDGSPNYETIWGLTKDTTSPSKPKSPKQESNSTLHKPSSPDKIDTRDGPRSPTPQSPLPSVGKSEKSRVDNQRNQRRYHPHNEKFVIPSPSPKPSSARSPLREDVFNYSPLPESRPTERSSKDTRYRSNPRNENTPSKETPRSSRNPRREVLLDFTKNGSAPPSARKSSHQSGGRVAEETSRRDRGGRSESQPGIRAAQSVPQLQAEQTYTTPTNSPDRSTRPRSADTRNKNHKQSRGKTCDFFYFFRWGKKKDKDKKNKRDGDSAKNNQHKRPTRDRSESPSGSGDRRERGRSGKSSGHSSRHNHHHRRDQSSEGKSKSDHRHHRPSSSSASRPLRTPASAATPSSEKDDSHHRRQYRQHHKRHEQEQQRKHHHHKSHSSPNENRPAYTQGRRKRERPSRSHQQKYKNQGGPATDDGRSMVSDITTGLRHEDLPPHPSIVKSISPKNTPAMATQPPVSGSYQKNTFVRAPGAQCGADIFKRGWRRSKSESPSNLRPGAASSGSNLELIGEHGGGSSSGPPARDISQPSATSRTDLDSASHFFTASSTDLRHNYHTPEASSPSQSLARSRSFHGFEARQQLEQQQQRQHLHYFNPEADTKVITDAEDFEFRPSDMSGPLHLSLCGCGFVGMYHLGVVACLVHRGPDFMSRIDKVAGASAGAIMAAVLVCCPDKIEDIGELFQNLARELRSRPLGALTPGYSFARSLRHLLDELLPDDAHVQASGRLHVSLTASASSSGGGNGKKRNNELMSNFESREELIEALVASSYIPLYSGMKMPVIRGKKYMDGGFSDNMPRFNSGRTITVSPFDGRSEISPKAGQEAKKAHFINVHNQEYQLNVRNMKKSAHAYFPPKRHVMQEYFDLGRFDASRFLIREGLYTIQLVYNEEKAVYVSSV